MWANEDATVWIEVRLNGHRKVESGSGRQTILLLFSTHLSGVSEYAQNCSMKHFWFTIVLSWCVFCRGAEEDVVRSDHLGNVRAHL